VDGRRNFPQDPGTPDPAARWYQDERGYPEEPEWERRAGYADPYAPDSYGSDSYSSPDSYSGYPDVPAPAAPPLPPVGPRSGEPLPPPVSGAAGFLGTPSAPPLHSIPPPGPHSVPPGPPGPGPGLHAGRPGSAHTGHGLADPAGSQTGEIPLEELGRRHAEPLDRTALRRPAAEPTGSVYRGRRPGLAALLIVATVVFELPVLRIFAASALADKVNASGTIASVFMIVGLPMFALGLYGLIGGAAAAAQGPRAWLRAPLAYLPVGLLLFLAAALAA
jgi:hypothetical protein